MGNWEPEGGTVQRTDVLMPPPTHTHTHTRSGRYLELHQVGVHVSSVGVLAHRVRELRHSAAGGPQPGLDLREVEHHLPVSHGVERRRLSGPTTTGRRHFPPVAFMFESPPPQKCRQLGSDGCCYLLQASAPS